MINRKCREAYRRRLETLSTKRAFSVHAVELSTKDIGCTENATRRANPLAQVGVPFEVHIFKERPHGLGLADQASVGSLVELDADATK
jgi:hypothetical protein